MNGAQALIRTLVDSGVDVCFMNPGTSEMHFVAALDEVPEMRGVLALFEGVATGAADGYARMAGRPAATLLHLGPGLGNGIANLHNARRASSPVVNVVGDHATTHAAYDAPLQSDIGALASNVSKWVRSSPTSDVVATDAAEAVAAATSAPGGVATLILPADVSWSEAEGSAPPRLAAVPRRVTGPTVDALAAVLRSDARSALLVGGRALLEDGLVLSSSVAATTDSLLIAETFPARITRGAGVPNPERLGYLAEFAQAQLEGIEHLVLVDAASPVTFFAYPDRASDLVPDGCEVHVLATGDADVVDALTRLAEAVGAPEDAAVRKEPGRPDPPTGELTPQSVAMAIGATLPDDAIVADEGNTSGLFVSGLTAGAGRHDWLCVTGGAIGDGLPMATGAAVACPDRPVLCLEADGSALYNIQALWTQAREGLDVTTLLFDNGAYAILRLELGRVGTSGGGPRAHDMVDLGRPSLDFVSIAEGLGVPAARATTGEELTAALDLAFSEPGPHLIQVTVEPMF